MGNIPSQPDPSSTAIATVTGSNYTTTIYSALPTPDPTQDEDPPNPYESCGIDPKDGDLQMFDYDEGVPLIRDGYQAVFAETLEQDFGTVALGLPPNDTSGYGASDLVYTDSGGAWILAIYDNSEIGFVTNSSNGPEFVASAGPSSPRYITSIWSLDCSAGLNAILPNGTQYSFVHDADTSHLTVTTASEATLRRRQSSLERIVRWATRHKGSSQPPPSQDEPRCNDDDVAKEKADAPPNTPNGCGAEGGPRIPQFSGMDFTQCCNGHDICFGDCSTHFPDCNNQLRSCQQNLCNGLPSDTLTEKAKKEFCLYAVDGYYGAVSGDKGRDAFRAASDERCECDCSADNPFCGCPGSTSNPIYEKCGGNNNQIVCCGENIKSDLCHCCVVYLC